MTPEREFANMVTEEAKKRGLSFFLVVVNDETEQWSYNQEIATSKPMVAGFFTWVKSIFDQAKRK